MRKKHILLIIVLLLLVGAVSFYFVTKNGEETNKPLTKRPSISNNKTAEENRKSQAFNKQKFSLTDPASPWVIANKHNMLSPKTYAPADLVVPNVPLRNNITSDEKQLRFETARSLEKMVAAAKIEGISLNVQSGYRSYNFQVTLYNRYVQQQGQVQADSQSARPGHSEHQTGLAVDLGGVTRTSCNVEACYADTAEGKWISEHAYEYGFVVRYPAGKTAITGYVYEPWHLRYVGIELSTEMNKTQITTLEEFFGLEAAPTYN